MNNLSKSITLILLVALSSSCKQSLIDHIDFKPSENLESLRVAVVFTKNLTVDFSGIFAIEPYGNAFVNPYTPTENFQVGFLLNTAIINDQNYIKLDPTDVLPNGVSTGIGYAVVAVHAPKPINEHYDIYAYVDVAKGAWLGSAVTFISPTANSELPSNVTITQGFLPDANKKNQVLASFYSPKKGTDGIATGGGIAVFANVKELLDHGGLVANETITVRPDLESSRVVYGP